MRTHTLIAFEGIDGSGKSTQVKLLAKRLRAQGHQVTTVSSPQYTKPLGKFIKDALHGKHGDFRGLTPYFSGLPYLLDFATMKDKLLAALKVGIVVTDRYVPSTLVYHGAKLEGAARSAYIRFVEQLMYKEVGLPKPNLVIYLKVPPVLARSHMETAGRELDQYEVDTAYQNKVASAYETRAKDRSWRTVLCRAGETPSEIHERVWQSISH